MTLAALIFMLLFGYALGAWRCMKVLTKDRALYERLREKYAKGYYEPCPVCGKGHGE